MRTKLGLLLTVGSLCALAQAAVQLEELSGQYTQGTHYEVEWWPDPIDPNEPNEPLITILQDIDGVPFWFCCHDDVTGEPADIYAITGGPELYVIVQVKVAAADGVSPGARNVGKILFDYGNVGAWLPVFHISGTLGTLGEDSRVAGIFGPFTVADIAAPFLVDERVINTQVTVTGPGPHQGDVTASEFVNADLTITGDFAGNLTVAHFAEPAQNPPSITITGSAPGTITIGTG